jgi:hypothetical protein
MLTLLLFSAWDVIRNSFVTGHETYVKRFDRLIDLEPGLKASLDSPMQEGTPTTGTRPVIGRCLCCAPPSWTGYQEEG